MQCWEWKARFVASRAGIFKDPPLGKKKKTHRLWFGCIFITSNSSSKTYNYEKGFFFFNQRFLTFILLLCLNKYLCKREVSMTLNVQNITNAFHLICGAWNVPSVVTTWRFSRQIVRQFEMWIVKKRLKLKRSRRRRRYVAYSQKEHVAFSGFSPVAVV